METLPVIRAHDGGLVDLLCGFEYRLDWPDYSGRYVTVKDGVGHWRPYESTKDNPVCDGCSCVPEARGMDRAAAAHDPCYLDMDECARVTGTPVCKLRKAADVTFRELGLSCGASKAVAWAEYFGVRLFGGIYHEVNKKK